MGARTPDRPRGGTFFKAIALPVLLLGGLAVSGAIGAKGGGCNAKGKGPAGACAPPVLVTVPMYFDDFEGAANRWKPATTGAIVGDQVLGGYCNFSTGTLRRNFALPVAHQGILIRANVHFLDRWEGEEAILRVDGQQVWNTSHHHCPKVFTEECAGINVVGDENFADTLGTAIELYIPHTAASATLEFATTLTGHACEASMAVDDVEIFIY